MMLENFLCNAEKLKILELLIKTPKNQYQRGKINLI